MRSWLNSPPVQRKKRLAKRPWTDAQSRPLAILVTKPKPDKRPRLRSKNIEADQALRLLKKAYPDAHCALNHSNAFELLVATILSAQCTDERVNMVTPALFDKYPDPKSLASAQLADVEDLIRSTGFFRNKAKNLIHCAQVLVDKFDSILPRTVEELQTLGGVGRKTANVVLGNAFGITSGVVVDTHVTRLSNRFGWVKSENPLKIEKRLCDLIPKKDWILVSHLLISHGRSLCKARKPMCEKCFLRELCPKIGV